MFLILRLSKLVSGDLGYHIWGFLLCGEASLFLSDVARLWVFVTSLGKSDKHYSWGTSQYWYGAKACDDGSTRLCVGTVTTRYGPACDIYTSYIDYVCVRARI